MACSHPDSRVVPFVGTLLVCLACDSTVTGPGGRVIQKLQRNGDTSPLAEDDPHLVKEMPRPPLIQLHQILTRTFRFAR